MDISERLRRFDIWYDAADKLAADNPQAAADMDFFREYFCPSIPNLLPPDKQGVRLTAFTGDGPKQDFFQLVYLMPEDIDYLGGDPEIAGILASDPKHGQAAQFKESVRAIFLSDQFQAEPWLRGILFLHELRHAHAFKAGQYRELGENGFWIEEAEVWLYEFELMETVKASDWRKALTLYLDNTKVTEQKVELSGRQDIDFLNAGADNAFALVHTVLAAQALYECIKRQEGELSALDELAGFLRRQQAGDYDKS